MAVPHPRAGAPVVRADDAALTRLINALAAPAAAAAAQAAAGEPAMGNAHRKSHGKGKAHDRDAHKHKDSAESGSKKGASGKKSEKRLSDHEGEVNGYLPTDEKSESAEAEEISTSHREGSQSAAGGSSTSLPPTAAKLKSEGNELFKSGQFGEAVLKYSEAIEYVTGLGEFNTLCFKSRTV